MSATDVADWGCKEVVVPVVPQISDAEWEVMKAVWECQPVPASDVVERLGREHKWAPRTIKTMLNRLVAKGALAYEVEGKRFLYKAKVNRDACIRRESRSFLSRVFDGSVAPAVVHLLTHSNLSDEDLKQLRRILNGEAK
jgi:BlaI family transcriptional regulator, penicillinase repressor